MLVRDQTPGRVHIAVLSNYNRVASLTIYTGAAVHYPVAYVSVGPWAWRIFQPRWLLLWLNGKMT